MSCPLPSGIPYILICAGLALVGKKEDVVVRRAIDQVRDEILLFCIEVYHADAAALLLAIFVRIGPLYIAALGQDSGRIPRRE